MCRALRNQLLLLPNAFSACLAFSCGSPKCFQLNASLAQDFFLQIGNPLRNIFLHQKKGRKINRG